MSDPRINPNYRGVKCKGCGERLPFLLTDLCSYCTHERDKNTIDSLRAEVDRLFAEQYSMADWCQIGRDAQPTIDRLRAEIERQQYAMKRAIVALRKHGSIAYAIRQLKSELPEDVAG